MNLGQMRQLLDGRDIRLTKSLGQNFLHDNNQIRRIADSGALEKTDRVLEIGPGLGPLTAELLQRAGHVRAIELDQRLLEILRERFASQPRLELVHGDALEIIRRPDSDWSGWKVVSNLPYSVGSPILVEFALHRRSPERIAATLQLEVVERLAAGPESDAYGILSLLVGLRYLCQGWFRIPAECFFPAPDVTSACVTLVKRPEPLLETEHEPIFVRVVKRAFSQRRKMMRKLLKAEWPLEVLDSAMLAAGIPATARAEELGIDRFVDLSRRLAQSRG